MLKMPGIISYLMGEELTVKNGLRNCASCASNARIINAYGSTEATVASAVAITDEMLATLKRSPLQFKEDSPTFIIDEAGQQITKMVSSGRLLYLVQLFQKVI